MIDSKLEKSKLQHLCLRAGFGPAPALIAQPGLSNWNRFFKDLVNGKGEKITRIGVTETRELADRYAAVKGKPDAERRRMIRKVNRQGMQHLNLAWIEQMVRTTHPLHEKMALFWHGHFACRVNNVLHNQLMLDVIRQHSLGSFKDLLLAVSKSPAMLQFLNNQQNRKQHPNENFGREVMELFTMGRGHYTENDVKEGSRAFTGWAFNGKGEFVFRKKFHDDGLKTFLGKTGHFDGDDILQIILEQKATARHITEKIYRFFVNETPDDHAISKLTEQFYQSGYHIGGLMEALFKSDDFYRPQNTGNLIKSPVELLVGIRRTVPVDFGKDQVQLLFQRLMDQVLFYPPNVGGWPGGRSWIDSSTLLFRMRLPQIIYYTGEIKERPKDMPDELTDTYSKGNMSDTYIKHFAKKVNASVDWESFLNAFKEVPDDGLAEAVAAVILGPSSSVNQKELNKYADQSSRQNHIKSLTINLMSTPDYQLC